MEKKYLTRFFYLLCTNNNPNNITRYVIIRINIYDYPSCVILRLKLMVNILITYGFRTKMVHDTTFSSKNI